MCCDDAQMVLDSWRIILETRLQREPSYTCLRMFMMNCGRPSNLDDYYLCLFSDDAANAAGDREWSLTLGDLFLRLDKKESILVHA